MQVQWACKPLHHYQAFRAPVWGRIQKLNGGLEEKKVSPLLASSSSSHLVHEIIFAVLVRKLASTIHISTQVCDQNGGSARRVKAGKTTGKTGRRVVRASGRPLCMECKSLASSDILSRNASMADMAMQCAGRCESEGVAGVVLFSAGAN